MNAETTLRHVPRGGWFVVVSSPEHGPYKLHALDGMYSYCTDVHGNVQHWRFDTPVVIAETPTEAA